MGDTTLWLVCDADHDLPALLCESGVAARRHGDSAAAAIAQAAPGDAVAVLARGDPAGPVVLDEALFAQAAARRIRLYLEFAAALPGLVVGPPVADKNLRGVVTSDFFGPELPPLRIVALNGCRYVPVRTERAHLVLARVVGVDTAVFGLADTPVSPLLFEAPGGWLLVATAPLSRFVGGRFMPVGAWESVWRGILRWLLPPAATVPPLRWRESVRPRYGREEALPPDAEAQALRHAADWVTAARLLRHPAWPRELLDHSLTFNTVREKPGANLPVGDGSLGVLEGFSSAIRPDGSQPVRYAVRSDCAGEVAMMMAFDAAVNGRAAHAAIAGNLLDFALLRSDLASRGPQADPAHPAHGLIAWELDKATTFWGDDNARLLLGALAVSALQKDARWAEAIARCLLANLRLTGPDGHRERCLEGDELAARGWRHYWRAPHVENTMHMQAWLPACYLWAGHRTGFAPLRARGEAALRTLMTAYPDRWEWVNGSGSLELARALLPLAWLVRVHDTPEHRGWLHRVATDLLALQDGSGAIREVTRVAGRGAYKDCLATSNAAYGTCETTLIGREGDPIADLLYTCNFALVGLHEAAAVTGDAAWRQAGDRLAGFLCRIQTQSGAHPELSGAWYRAFNFRNWDYWAANSDSDWGAWCQQSGWTQPWIGGALALRTMRTSLWDLLQQAELPRDFYRICAEVLPEADR